MSKPTTVSTTLAQHCITVYQAMVANSEDGIFVGSLAELYNSTGISRSHYRKIWSLLVDSGCITRQTYESAPGTRRSASRVILHRPPTVEEFGEMYLTPEPHSDKTLIEARISALERRIGDLNIAVELGELNKRIDDLEAIVKYAKKS